MTPECGNIGRMLLQQGNQRMQMLPAGDKALVGMRPQVEPQARQQGEVRRLGLGHAAERLLDETGAVVGRFALGHVLTYSSTRSMPPLPTRVR